MKGKVGTYPLELKFEDPKLLVVEEIPTRLAKDCTALL